MGRRVTLLFMARVDHKKIRQLIAQKQKTVTDRQFFSSRAFAAYFADMALAQIRRYGYHRRVKVRTVLCPPASGHRPQQSVSLFATQALACSSVRPVTPLIHRPWMSWAPSRGVPPQQGKLPPLARPHLYLRQQPRLRRRPLRNCRRWRRPCVPPALSRDIRIRRWAIWSRLTPTHWFGSLPNSPVMQRSLQLRNSSAIRRWQAHKQTLWRGGTKVSSLHREEPLWTIT